MASAGDIGHTGSLRTMGQAIKPNRTNNYIAMQVALR